MKKFTCLFLAMVLSCTLFVGSFAQTPSLTSAQSLDEHFYQVYSSADEIPTDIDNDTSAYAF